MTVTLAQSDELDQLQEQDEQMYNSIIWNNNLIGVFDSSRDVQIEYKVEETLDNQVYVEVTVR